MLAHFSTNQPSCNKLECSQSPIFQKDHRNQVLTSHLAFKCTGGGRGRAPGFLASSQTVPRPLSRLCTFETKVAARSRRS